MSTAAPSPYDATAPIPVKITIQYQEPSDTSSWSCPYIQIPMPPGAAITVEYIEWTLAPIEETPAQKKYRLYQAHLRACQQHFAGARRVDDRLPPAPHVRPRRAWATLPRSLLGSRR